MTCVARRERRVSSFAGHHPSLDAREVAGDTKAGSRRDHHHGLTHDGASFAHRHHIVVAEMWDRPRQSFEIVHETDRLKMQRLPQAFSVECPLGVGEFAAAARDGPGRGNHRAIHDNVLLLTVEEMMHGIVHAGVSTGPQGFNRSQPPARQQCEAGARAADIGQEVTHRTLP